MSFKKDKIDKIKIATLNVEGFDEENCRETLNRLNRRNFDIINLQNINLNKPNRDYAKEHYWRYDSIWTSNTAILAGNENIQFNDTEEFENGITTIVKYYKMTLQITNIYISSLIDGLKLCKQWMPYRSENIINVIVCESEEISLHLIYNEENEEIPGFTNVVDILGERFIQGAQDNNFPDCIYIDNDYTHFCKKIEVFYDEFSKPLVVCTLESFIWKLKKQMLEDPKVVYDITKEITSVNTVYEWDQLKNQFQSVFRSSKLNFFEEPKKELMSFDDIDSSDGDFDSLDQTLQNELIKGGWAKKNENATSVVRDPSAPDSKDPTEIFIYIKTYYQKLFKKDDFDIDIATGDENYQKLKDNETTKYLGFSIDKKGQLEENYWDKVAENIKKTMQEIDQNELSSEDKMCIVTIAKSHLFSKIWYTAFLLPPNDEQIKLLSKLILEWVWNKLPPELINLEIPKLKNMVDARLGRIWLKLLTNNDLWANLERELIEKNLNEPITTALQQPAKLNDWPLEWMPYFRAWQRLNGKVLSTDSWPWNLNSIEIADLNADEYSIKSAVKYLENDNTQYVVI
ncbi:14868_t:CDS:2 [Gigaspora margarita]|uniref:14868_t:CDS:1 n=1 Tax=Gigaspora margarita TaxID=4874 RepID=A0ABN7UYV6_GIGMA|nr:14868_t:CDS:2 [Gigaspora margarita]